jgi:hypothetical protein
MVAEVAIPPSPEEEANPVPATVVIRYDGTATETIKLQAAKTKKKRTNERTFMEPIWMLVKFCISKKN